MLSSSQIPLYQQVADALREKIRSGVWKGGMQIPPEDKLGEEFNVSRITVRHALQILVNERLLIKQRPRGTFVRPTDERGHILSTYNRGFTEELIEQGRDPRTIYATVELTPANLEIAQYLKVDPTVPVIYLQRMRGDGQRAFVYFESWLTYIPQMPLKSECYYGSLYTLLRERGIVMTKQFEEFEAILPDERIQSALKVKRETPILSRTIGASSTDGVIREYSKCFYIGSEYLYRFDYL